MLKLKIVQLGKHWRQHKHFISKKNMAKWYRVCIWTKHKTDNNLNRTKEVMFGHNTQHHVWWNPNSTKITQQLSSSMVMEGLFSRHRTWPPCCHWVKYDLNDWQRVTEQKCEGSHEKPEKCERPIMSNRKHLQMLFLKVVLQAAELFCILSFCRHFF